MTKDASTETIAAVATPRGVGAISLLRLSGPKTLEVMQQVFKSSKSLKSFPRALLLGNIVKPATGNTIDNVLAAFFPAPNSYTGEDMAEIHTHGGIFVTNNVFETLLSQGARAAYPGEFTLRAFANGKLGLTQAEAVLDVINARNERFLKIALNSLFGKPGLKIKNIREQLVNLLARIEVVFEYPEEDVPDVPLEDIENELIKAAKSIEEMTKTYKSERLMNQGPKIVLIGRPNVGKSSIMNQLIGEKRSIVNESPGTTRDLVGEWTNFLGIDVLIMDTAGITSTDNTVEKEAVARAKEFADKEADEIMLILDASEPLQQADFDIINDLTQNSRNFNTIMNKIDLEQRIDEEYVKKQGNYFKTSALTGDGIKQVKDHIEDRVRNTLESITDVLVTNIRHKKLLDKASEALDDALNNLGGLPQDILTIDIRKAADLLGEITGDILTDDIIENIFSNFCVGK